MDDLRIGRVIARPFVGSSPADFARTSNRRDYAVPPHEPTLLDRLAARGSRVFGVGKIADIFAHRGVTDISKASDKHEDVRRRPCRQCSRGGDGDLVFVQLRRFQIPSTVTGAMWRVMLRPSRRSTGRLPEALELLEAGDMLMLTGDHGCDPTWPGTDHTRERVPILGTGPGLASGQRRRCGRASPISARPLPSIWACRRAPMATASLAP